MREQTRAIKEVGKGLLKFEFPTRSPHCGTSRYAGTATPKRMHRLLTFILLPLFALPSAVAASSVLVDLESSQTILADRPRTPENASSMLPLMTVYTTLELLKMGRLKIISLSQSKILGAARI